MPRELEGPSNSRFEEYDDGPVSSGAPPVIPLSYKTDVGRVGGGVISGWSADDYYTGGTDYSFPSPIDITGLVNPAPADVYRSPRYDPVGFSYAFTGFAASSPVAMRLHFAADSGAAGFSVVDVSVNGAIPAAFDNIDIATLAGNVANKGVIVEYTGAANASGQVNLVITNVSGGGGSNALLSGIELLGTAA